MYDLSINKLYILLGNLYICPHNRKVFVRMVILLYPATSARVHFTKCNHCATAASFRRWLAPVVGAFLTVAYRWSSWGPVQLTLVIFTFDVNILRKFTSFGTSVSSLHPWRYCCGHFQFIRGNSDEITNFW